MEDAKYSSYVQQGTRKAVQEGWVSASTEYNATGDSMVIQRRFHLPIYTVRDEHVLPTGHGTKNSGFGKSNKNNTKSKKKGKAKQSSTEMLSKSKDHWNPDKLFPLQNKLVALVRDLHEQMPFLKFNQVNEALGINTTQGRCLYDWCAKQHPPFPVVTLEQRRNPNTGQYITREERIRKFYGWRSDLEAATEEGPEGPEGQEGQDPPSAKNALDLCLCPSIGISVYNTERREHNPEGPCMAVMMYAEEKGNFLTPDIADYLQTPQKEVRRTLEALAGKQGSLKRSRERAGRQMYVNWSKTTEGDSNSSTSTTSSSSSTR